MASWVAVRILDPVIDAPQAGFRSLGQPAARRMALRAAGTRGGRTILVHGPAGAGKGAFVDDLLALAFCTDPDPSRRPCNACRGCRDARARTHPDLVIGSPAAWRDLRATGESIVAAARRWLLDASGAPVIADRRIVLVESADEAGEVVQNALLKTLEEPTDRHLFILVADEPARLLPTIRSRSQALRLGPVPRAELARHLVEKRGLPQDQADALAMLANGLPELALGFADRTDLLDWRRRTQARLIDLLGRGPADRFEAVRDLLDEAIPLATGQASAAEDESESRTPAGVKRAAATLVAEAWLSLARDLAVAGAGRTDLAPGAELSSNLGPTGARIGVERLAAMIRLLERVIDGIRDNASPRLALERAMLAWPRIGS